MKVRILIPRHHDLQNISRNVYHFSAPFVEVWNSCHGIAKLFTFSPLESATVGRWKVIHASWLGEEKLLSVLDIICVTRLSVFMRRFASGTMSLMRCSSTSDEVSFFSSTYVQIVKATYSFFLFSLRANYTGYLILFSFNQFLRSSYQPILLITPYFEVKF